MSSRWIDLFKVLKGVNIITKTSYEQWRRQTRHATSKLTVYPASPLSEVAGVVKNVSDSVVNRIMYQRSTQHHATSAPTTQEHWFQSSTQQQQQQQQQTSTIYYNTFGNVSPTSQCEEESTTGITRAAEPLTQNASIIYGSNELLNAANIVVVNPISNVNATTVATNAAANVATSVAAGTSNPPQEINADINLNTIGEEQRVTSSIGFDTEQEKRVPVHIDMITITTTTTTTTTEQEESPAAATATATTTMTTRAPTTISDSTCTTASTATTAATQTPMMDGWTGTEMYREHVRERAVPSSSITRAFHFSGLGAQLIYGTMSEMVRRRFRRTRGTMGNDESTETTTTTNTEGDKKSAFVNEQNAEALARALCRMRGAALKLGQMLSIQDEHLVSPVIQRALERVRHAADIMPRRQLEQVLREELGENWREGFLEFDLKPIAAASIGQVHRAVLKKDGREVAVKVQYPGVANSIDSDIKNLKLLVDYTNLIPRGAFINDTMNQARKELKMECDYEREAECQRRFKRLIQQATEEENERIRKEGKLSQFDPPMSMFHVPDVIDEYSTKRVLTSEMVKGETIDRLASMDLETRNRVARLLLKLCLKELFEFRFMQTDPNWSNFFYDTNTDTLHLIDFGACMEFPSKFIDEYIRVVYASASKDRDTIVDASIKMGFLTGEETQTMLDAHTKAAILVGEPFSREGIYKFRTDSIPEKVGSIIPTMLKHRLTPPPPVTYSLHRKLSGAFLLCYKLRAEIPCRDIFMDCYDRYQSSRIK
jgi:aarF domain-containing kinase